MFSNPTPARPPQMGCFTLHRLVFVALLFDLAFGTSRVLHWEWGVGFSFLLKRKEGVFSNPTPARPPQMGCFTLHRLVFVALLFDLAFGTSRVLHWEWVSNPTPARPPQMGCFTLHRLVFVALLFDLAFGTGRVLHWEWGVGFSFLLKGKKECSSTPPPPAPLKWGVSPCTG